LEAARDIAEVLNGPGVRTVDADDHAELADTGLDP
jgi:hypothetical protein